MSSTLSGLFDTFAECESVMDVAGRSPDLAIALNRKFDCDVFVVALGPNGKFDATICADYVARLKDAGVAHDKIRVVAAKKDLRPADVILALDGFGDRWKVKHLTPVLDNALHSGTSVFIDIRKGTGAFPFLKTSYGETTILEELEGDTLRRVLMRPTPRAQDQTWPQIARGLAGEDGFFADGPTGHSFLYVPRSKDVLVVTFDNLDLAMNKRDDRRPWGYEFIEKQGWSMMGVMAGGWTWYREPWVAETFDRLRDEGFFGQFKRVVFYGASMGGYAAAAFSAACPGADVVVISPQSTLDRTLVPFETRYQTGWDYDYSGRYGDAARVSDQARNVLILFDPYEPLDAGHVARFDGANVTKLRCPLMGHRLGSSLSQMGVLSSIIVAALQGTLRQVDFYRMLRARHSFPRYQKELFARTVRAGRPGLALRVGRWVLARGDNRAIRLGMAELQSRPPATVEKA